MPVETMPTVSESFAFLTYPRADDPRCASRAEGARVGAGVLTLEAGSAGMSGVAAGAHLAALSALLPLLTPEELGDYTVVSRRDHRAPVEGRPGEITLDPRAAADPDVLALAWLAALTVARGGDARAALRRITTARRHDCCRWPASGRWPGGSCGSHRSPPMGLSRFGCTAGRSARRRRLRR